MLVNALTHMTEDREGYGHAHGTSPEGASATGACGGRNPLLAPVAGAQFQSLSDLQADLAELAHEVVLGVQASSGVDDQVVSSRLEGRFGCLIGHRGRVGKRVLHLGCGWPPSLLHQAMAPVASHLDGVDIDAPATTRENIWRVDLDAHPELVPVRDYDVIIAGEILEHLGNPGNLLCTLRRLFPTTLLVVSVPNALGAAALAWAQRGYENVHAQHTAWFSWHTAKELLERCGYRILNFAWYEGQPITAEGLVFIAEPAGG